MFEKFFGKKTKSDIFLAPEKKYLSDMKGMSKMSAKSLQDLVIDVDKYANLLLQKIQACKAEYEKVVEKNEEIKEKLDVLNAQSVKVSNEHEELSIKFDNLQTSLEYMSTTHQALIQKESNLLGLQNIKNIQVIFDTYHQKALLCDKIQAQNKILKNKLIQIEEKHLQIININQNHQLNVMENNKKEQQTNQIIITNESSIESPTDIHKNQEKKQQENKLQSQQQQCSSQINELKIKLNVEIERYRQLQLKFFTTEMKICEFEKKIKNLNQTLNTLEVQNKEMKEMLSKNNDERIFKISEANNQLQQKIKQMIENKQNSYNNNDLLQEREKNQVQLQNMIFQLNQKMKKINQQNYTIKFESKNKDQKIAQLENLAKISKEQKSKLNQQFQRFMEEKDMLLMAHNETITAMSLDLNKYEILKKQYEAFKKIQESTRTSLQTKQMEFTQVQEKLQKEKQFVDLKNTEFQSLKQKITEKEDLLLKIKQELNKKEQFLKEKNQYIEQQQKIKRISQEKIKQKQQELQKKELLLNQQNSEGSNRIRRAECELNQERIKNESMTRKINNLEARAQESKTSLNKMYQQMIVKDKKINFMEIKLKEYKSTIQLMRKEKEDIEKTYEYKIKEATSKQSITSPRNKEFTVSEEKQRGDFEQTNLKNQILSMKEYLQIIKEEKNNLLNLVKEKDQDLQKKDQTIKILQSKRDQIMREIQKMSNKNNVTQSINLQQTQLMISKELIENKRKYSIQKILSDRKKDNGGKTSESNSHLIESKEKKIATKAIKGFQILLKMQHSLYKNFINLFANELQRTEIKNIENEVNLLIKKCSDLQDLFYDYTV